MISSEGRSELDIGPGGFVFLLWVESSWIREFTIVVLSVECGLSIFADLDVVGNELSVGHVLIEVILEVLDQVHVLLNEVVSSNSWESEGVVIKLPCMNIDSWVLSFFVKLSVDLNGIIVMLSIKVS